MSISEDLSKLAPLFKGSEWCNDCREWHDSKLKECPDCKEEKRRDELKEQNAKLRAAIKVSERILTRLLLAAESNNTGQEDDLPLAIIEAKQHLLFEWKDFKMVLREKEALK